MKRNTIGFAVFDPTAVSKTLVDRRHGEVVSEALVGTLKEERREALVASMEDGYRNMADLNLQFAEIGFDTDASTLLLYESILLSERD